jgi:DNA-binding helix-hairpin-helix protein with protein kinase domain
MTPPVVEDRLGAGGEADVLAVPGRPDLAFKRYRRPSAARTDKLRVMLRNPPDDRPDIAWPLELVGSGTDAEGFLMRRVDLRRNVPLFQVYNPASRRKVAPAITWKYLLRTARNTAAIVDALHRAGYVVGDLNESNLLVDGRAVVTLVDCDSMQVRDPDDGRVFPCAVGKPEFTPPELHRADLSTTERTAQGDAFGLAVLVFLLLLEGTHPFASVWTGRGDPPDIATRIRRRAFPHAWWRRLRHRMAPPPLAVPLGILPWRLRRLVRRAFTSGLRWPSRRPTAREWVAALEHAESRLAPCRRSDAHLKPRRGFPCPWCRRVDRGVVDPFPGPEGVGVQPRPTARWRTLAARVPRPPDVPAAVLTVGAAVVAAAVVPLVALAAVVVILVVTETRHEQGGLRARVAVGACGVRTVASKALVAVALGPVVAALVVAAHPVPSAFVLSGRVAAMIAVGWLAAGIPVPPVADVRGSRRIVAAVAVLGAVATHVAAWWWPLGV